MLLAAYALAAPGRADAVVSPAWEGLSVTGNPAVVTVPAPGGLAVNTFTGSVFMPRQLLPVMPGRGVPLDLSLSYNSVRQNWPAGSYGFGWNLSYQVWIFQEANGNVVVHWGDGRLDRWHPTPEGLQPFNRSVFVELKEPEPGTWVLRTPKGVEYEFKRPAVGEKQPMRAIRDPNGNELTIESSGLRPLSITDASGRRVTLTYNNRGRLTQLTDTSTSPARDVRFTYLTTGEQTSMTDALGNVYSYTYDSGHRLTRVQDPAGITTVEYSGPRKTVSRIRRTTLAGEVLAERTFTFANRVTSVTDMVDGTTAATRTYAYPNARSVIVTDPLGKTSSIAYDTRGNPTSLVDGNGNRWAWTYDARGNVLTRRDPLGRVVKLTYDPTYNVPLTHTNAAGQVTRFGYDNRGNLTSIKDPLGQTTSLDYDARGQVVERDDAAGKLTRFDYDGFGNLTKVTDPLGRERTFAYDGASRLVRATSTATDVSYEYDSLNRIVAVDDGTARSTYAYDALGNLSGALGPDTDLAFDWDPAGRLVQVDDQRLGKTIGYRYDGVGNQVEMQADGRTVTYAYDLAGRLTGIADGADQYALAYDDGGRLTQLTYPNGVRTEYGYDAADQLTALTSRRAGGALIASSAYAYDAAGRRLSESRSTGETLTYGYDAAGRLLREQRAGGTDPYLRSYTYDPAGNRTTLDSDGTVTTYAYDDAGQLIEQHTGADAVSYAYDPSGNLTTRTDAAGQTAYEYDSLGRMTGMSAPGGSVAYRYDAFGNRVSATDADGTTALLYDFTAALPEPVATYGGGGWLLAQYTSGTLATGRLGARTSAASYLLNDAQLSPIATLGAGAAVQASHDRDAWGLPPANLDPKALAGHPYDARTGLYEVGGRAYDPATARFNQPSPTGETSPYSFAANSPTAATFATGEVPVLTGRLSTAKGALNVGGGGLATLDKTGSGLRSVNQVGPFAALTDAAPTHLIGPDNVGLQGFSGSDKDAATWGGGAWFAQWSMSDPNLALTSRVANTAYLTDITSAFYNGALANSCGTFPAYAVGNVP